MAIKNLSLNLLRKGLSKPFRKKKALPKKKYYAAMKKTKVLSCILVFVILMSAVPVSVFAVNDGKSTDFASLAENKIIEMAGDSQYIKFQGTAVRQESSGLPVPLAWWVVTVAKVISGPQPSEDTINIVIGGGVMPKGYVDPDITPGDKVELYGRYSSGWVSLTENSHYIKRIDGTGDGTKIIDYTISSGAYCPDNLVRASMRYKNNENKQIKFKGIFEVRSPTGEICSTYKTEITPSRQEDEFAAGDRLLIRIPEDASTGWYDARLELSNYDTGEKYDGTGWIPKQFRIKQCKPPKDWSEDIRITNDPADSINPKIAVDSKNNIHIVWEDNRDGSYGIYYTKIDNKGNKLVEDKKIVPLSFSDYFELSAYDPPSIAIDSNGNIHLSFIDYIDSAIYEVLYLKLDNTGNVLSSVKRVDSTAALKRSPDIAVDSQNNVHIVWEDYRSGNSEAYHVKLGSTGYKLVDNKRLSTGAYPSGYPCIATDSNNNAHVAWGGGDIYYTKVNSAGSITKQHVLSYSTPSFFPSIAVDASNNVHVCWAYSEWSWSKTTTQIHYAKLNENGGVMVHDKQISDSTSATHPVIAVDSNKDIQVVWRDWRDENMEIYYKKLDNTGNGLSEDTRLTIDTATSAKPDIACDSNNCIHVTWVDSRDGNNEIYYKTAGGTQKLPVHNIDTAENFAKIQEAIDDEDTDDGDTIIVDPGTYYEDVIVTKSLIIKGIDMPVVDPRAIGNAFLVGEDGCTIEGFNATGASSYGYAGIKVTSGNNKIFNNSVVSNFYGIFLHSSTSDNIICGNNVTNNKYGICVDYDSDNNLIYHNNIIQNTNQAYGNTGANRWNYTYPSGGNYWSDYEEKYKGEYGEEPKDDKCGPKQEQQGSDGIWDKPYEWIGGSADTEDNYPLVNPLGELPDLIVEEVTFSDPFPRWDDKVKINATIKNIGSKGTIDSDFTVRFDFKSPFEGENIDPVEKIIEWTPDAEEKKVTHKFTPEYAGVYEINVTVDSKGDIPEANEDNNKTDAKLDVNAYKNQALRGKTSVVLLFVDFNNKRHTEVDSAFVNDRWQWAEKAWKDIIKPQAPAGIDIEYGIVSVKVDSPSEKQIVIDQPDEVKVITGFNIPEDLNLDETFFEDLAQNLKFGDFNQLLDFIKSQGTVDNVIVIVFVDSHLKRGKDETAGLAFVESAKDDVCIIGGNKIIISKIIMHERLIGHETLHSFGAIDKPVLCVLCDIMAGHDLMGNSIQSPTIEEIGWNLENGLVGGRFVNEDDSERCFPKLSFFRFRVIAKKATGEIFTQSWDPWCGYAHYKLALPPGQYELRGIGWTRGMAHKGELSWVPVLPLAKVYIEKPSSINSRHDNVIVQNITVKKLSSSSMQLFLKCPIDMIITAPNGKTIKKDNIEIPNCFYDELPDDGGDLVTIFGREMGNYQIAIVPDMSAKSNDTFSLEVLCGNQSIIMAENVSVSDIPDKPYVIESTEAGITQPLFASFTHSPANPIVNEIVTFDASDSTSTGGYITDYKWDFGDEGTGTGKIITHSYTSAGNYDVTLTVTDDNGAADTNTKTITVYPQTSIQLHTGWNLISMPVMPDDTDITTVLSPISGNYSIIWTYNASDTSDYWKKYDPGAPFGNDLPTMEPGKGYWILMTSDDTLPITGTVPLSMDIDLTTGWNLIGYSSLDSQPVADALSSISGNYNIVWAYEAGDSSDHWKKYDSSAPFGNDLTIMEPGKGYWILMNSDATLKI